MEEADLISNLPDALLVAIVSFLPSKEGVRTSVLSHRWKTVWKYSSHLGFNQKKFKHPLIDVYLRSSDISSRLEKAIRRKEFPGEQEFVDEIAETSMLIRSILDSHIGPLKSCSIQHLPESCASGDVVGWMMKLLDKGARKVSMVLEPYDSSYPRQIVHRDLKKHFRTLNLPFELFSNFEFLELKNYRLVIPSSPNPPKILKALKLINVHISSDDFEGIIFHCSSLETLILRRCVFIGDHVKIESESLRVFKIYKMIVSQILVYAINLEAIEIDSICCPHQEMLFGIPKLQFFRSYNHMERAHNPLPNGKKFLTTSDIIEIFVGILGPQPSRTPATFESLVGLYIDIDLTNIRNIMALSFGLKSYHHLKTLEINNQVNDNLLDYGDLVYDENEADCLPYPKNLFWHRREPCECVNRQLKNLCISGYTGKEFEMEFVKYMITNAGAMESITLWFVDDCLWVDATATTCLLSYPRASPKLSIDLKPGKSYLKKVGGNFQKWVTTLKL